MGKYKDRLDSIGFGKFLSSKRSSVFSIKVSI